MDNVTLENYSRFKYISKEELREIVKNVKKRRLLKENPTCESPLVESLAEIDKELINSGIDEKEFEQVLEKPKVSNEEHIAAGGTCDYKELNKKYSKNRKKKFCQKCNSKSESSLSQLPVRLDSVVVAKILVLQKKISNTLYKISYELDQIPLPDGENDLHRRQKRSSEFSVRLARNYLYDLDRYSLEIEKQINLTFGEYCSVMDRRALILGLDALEQKLISAHQLLLHALTAYFKNISTSVLRGQPGKLKELLEITLRLRGFGKEINLLSDCNDLDKDVEKKCAEILSKFEKMESESPKNYLLRSTRKKNRKKLFHRLSMYCMGAPLPKFHKPGRVLNRRPDLATSKKSCMSFKTKNERKVKNKFSEDDVRTVVETIPADDYLENCNYDAEINRLTDLSNRNRRFNLRRDVSMENVKNKDYLFSFVPIVGDIMSAVEHNNLTDSHLGKKENQQTTLNNLTPKNMQVINLASNLEDKRTEKSEQEKTTTFQKNKITKLKVSEKTLSVFLNYREEFQKSVRDDPMYAVSKVNKPWELISWISSKLTEKLIFDLCQELQMNDIIDQLYELEFKEF